MSTIHITIDDIANFGRRDYEIFAHQIIGENTWEGHAYLRHGLSATSGLGDDSQWSYEKGRGYIPFPTEQEALVAAFLDCLSHSGKDIGEDQKIMRTYTLSDAMRELMETTTTPTRRDSPNPSQP